MKIPDNIYILILFIVILILSLTGYWRFKEFDRSLSEIELPEIPSAGTTFPEINLEDFLPPEKEGYQEWVSPNEKLKLQYPASWEAIDKSLLGSFDQTEIPLAESEVLFFAHQINIKEQTFTVLTISEFDALKSLKEIVEEIEKNTKEQGGKIQITISEDENKDVWLEMTSEHLNQPNFYSKGKLIFTDDKAYLIIFNVTEKDWPKSEEKANEIFNSIQRL